ncbi:MAG: carbon monoxide dehydrogenase accessory protein CooC [Euryarchaeota archaeon]|nr:carbon monoxide dehydrogenase accessory protein CooC [Euryarchaeota archaeon]
MMKIAITGKGGVGKTTLAGTLARLFAEDGFAVLAIDADPDMNLASAIGIENPPAPLAEQKKLIEERAGTGMGGVFKLNPKVDDIVERFGVTERGVSMLTMGTVDTGGSGCMCPASSLLRALLRHVLLREESVVIIDMEAGIEHLGRGTARGVDLMIVVVEPGARSIETAARIRKLSREIGIKRLVAVVNRADERSLGIISGRLDELGIAVIGTIPYDAGLVQADIMGKAPFDAGCGAVSAIGRVKDAIACGA